MILLRLRLSLLSSVSLFLWINAASCMKQPCYYLNGDLALDHSPCWPNDQTSPCCLLTNDTATSDVCLSPSGFCLATNNLIYQGGCTDKRGESDLCAHHICPDATSHWTGKASSKNWAPRQQIQFWNVLVCSRGNVCCQNAYDGPNCCNDSSLIIPFYVGMPSAAAVVSSSTTAVVSSTTTAVVSSSTTAVTNSSCTAAGSCKTPQITTMGVAVGVPLGVLVASAIAGLFFLLHRRRFGKIFFDGAQRINPAPAIPRRQTVNRNVELDANNAHELPSRD